MKTKTYEIEVVHTCRVKVVLPETMTTEQTIKDWESGLWPLQDGVDSIAKYAAEMAVLYPNSDHDGIGVLHMKNWEKPDYEKNPYTVVADVFEDDTELHIYRMNERIEAIKHRIVMLQEDNTFHTEQTMQNNYEIEQLQEELDYVEAYISSQGAK